MNLPHWRRKKTLRVTGCFVCFTVCVACSGGPDEPRASDQAIATKSTDLKITAAPQRKGELMTQKKSAVGPLDARMQGFAEWASKDLAARLAVEVDQIELVEADYVTWRDSSLGCAKPGVQYMQALVEGTRIKLRNAGKIYHYHGGKNNPPPLCENPASNEPMPYGPSDA